MSELRGMFTDTAARVLADTATRDMLNRAEQGEWPAALWDRVEQSGLSAAAATEARGGSGLDLGDLGAMLRVAAGLAAPVPLAETWLAELMLDAAALPPVSGPASVGPCLREALPSLTRNSGRWELYGRLQRIPWGRNAASLVVIAASSDGPRTVSIPGPAVAAEGWSYAREPRDTVVFDALALQDTSVGPANAGFSHDDLLCRGALFRSLAMAGAIEKVMELTIQYAKDRTQFGRAIGKFQAVQQQIAVLASQAAAAGAAADAALQAASSGPARFEIAAAKTRTGEAAGIVASIAHQVHGAMGFTHEHALNRSTRRLWSWRDEFGSEAEWARFIGETATAVGGDGLWAFLTTPNAPIPGRATSAE